MTALDRASTTFLRLASTVERLEKRLDALDRKRVNVTVDADTSRATRKVETLDKSFGAATIRVAALGRALKTLAIPGAIVAATPSIASLGASAVQAAGSLWLLPAAVSAGAVAFGALKVGMAGFGEAMKNLGDSEKFAEAIAKLSPAAREAATTIRGLVPAWKEMQGTVQERLFTGIAEKISALSEDIIPMLGDSFGLVADGANRAAGGILDMLNTTARLADLDTIVTASAQVWVNLLAAVQPLTAAFLDIAAVGGPILAELTAGAGGAASAFALFVANARASGQLESWIRGGLDVLRQLGQLTANVGSILGSMFGAAERSGESFLGMLVRVTGSIAAYLKTPEGAAGLTEFFTTVRTMVGLLWDKLVQLWPAISAAGQAFAALLIAAAPVSNVIFGLVATGLVPLLDAIRFLAPVLGPALVLFGTFRVVMAGVTAAMTAYRIATGIATAVSVGYQLAMGTNLVLTQGQAAAQAAHTLAVKAGAGAAKIAAAAQWVLNAAMSANPIMLVVIAIAALVAGLVLAWNYSETFRNVVIGAWEAVKNAASAVFGWLAEFIPAAWNGLVSFITGIGPAIASAATAAWDWLVSATTTAIDAVIGFVTSLPNRIMFALGALAGFLLRAAIDGWAAFTTGLRNGWAATVAFFVSLPSRIGAFLVTLGASLYAWAVQAWNNFTTGINTAWASTIAFFVALPSRIGAFLINLGASIYAWAVQAWDGFTNGLTAAWAATIAWFVALPAKIGAFFANAGTWLLQTGLDLVAGLIMGVTQAWNGLWAWIGGLITSFIDGVKAGFGIASPSTIFAEIGNFLIQGLIQGIQVAATFLWGVVTSIASGVVNLIMTGISVLAGLWATVWNGIVLVFQTVWNTIRSVATAVWGGLVAYFQASWAAYQAMWAAVWNGITAVFTAVWNGIRAVAMAIWNGIVAYFQASWAAYQAMWSAVWNAVTAVFTAVWDGIRAVAVAVWNGIAAFFSGAFNAFVSFFQGIWNGISAFFTGIWARIQATVTYYWALIQHYYNTALAAFSAFWSGIWTSIWTFFTDLWNRIYATVMYYWAMIQFYYNVALAAFSKFWSDTWDAIWKFFSDLWDRLYATVQYYWAMIKHYYDRALIAFSTFWSDTWDSIVGTFDRIWSSITDIARRVWEGVRNAFVEGINWVIDKINIFADAINKVAGLLGFEIDLRIPKLATGGPVNMAAASAGANALARARQDGGPIGLASGGGVDASGGGRLPATGTLRDTLPALAGRQRYLLQGKEWIIRSSASRALGANTMAMINQADRRPVDVVPRGQARERVALYAQGGGLAPIPMASAGQIAAAASALVPGSRMSSGFRPGDPGMHGRNQAADMVGNLGAINRAWAGKYGASTDQLIYTPGINLFHGRPHTYNAATRADHYDHVHIGYSGVLTEGGAGGGWFGAVVSFLLDQAKALLNPVRDMLIPIKDDPANGFGKRAMAGGGLKMIDWLFAVAEAQDAAANAMGPAGPGSGPVVDQVRAVANRYGWGSGPQWDALSRLIQKESSWNPTAQNPTSTAYGLFQFLNSTWGTVGGSKTSNPGQQAEYGLRYIRQRYNDPVGALRFHNANNWYDQGGLAVGRGVMMKETLRPERVLDPRTTVTFERLTDWLSSPSAQRALAFRPEQFGTLDPTIARQMATARAGRSSSAGGGDGVTVNIGSVVTPPGVTAPVMASSITREMRVARHGGRYRR